MSEKSDGNFQFLPIAVPSRTNLDGLVASPGSGSVFLPMVGPIMWDLSAIRFVFATIVLAGRFA